MAQVCTPFTFDQTTWRFDQTDWTWDKTETCVDDGALPPFPATGFYSDVYVANRPARRKKRLDYILLLLS